MANRFDIVAVGIAHESPVIIGMVMRPQAGRAIVFSSGAQRGMIESIDLGPRLRDKGHVHGARRRRAVANPEKRLSPGPEASVSVLVFRPSTVKVRLLVVLSMTPGTRYLPSGSLISRALSGRAGHPSQRVGRARSAGRPRSVWSEGSDRGGLGRADEQFSQFSWPAEEWGV